MRGMLVLMLMLMLVLVRLTRRLFGETWEGSVRRIRRPCGGPRRVGFLPKPWPLRVRAVVHASGCREKSRYV